MASAGQGCRTISSNYFVLTDCLKNKVQAFQSVSFTGISGKAAHENQKQLKHQTCEGVWKINLSPFTQCIMNNPKWRQQSGFTFWGACGRSNFRGMLKRTEAEESQNGTSSKMFHGYHWHGCPRCSPAPKQQKEVVAFEKIKKGYRKLTREMQFAQTLQRRQVILDEGFRKRKLSDMPSCLIRDCAGHGQTQAVDKEPVVWK